MYKPTNKWIGLFAALVLPVTLMAQMGGPGGGGGGPGGFDPNAQGGPGGFGGGPGGPGGFGGGPGGPGGFGGPDGFGGPGPGGGFGRGGRGGPGGFGGPGGGGMGGGFQNNFVELKTQLGSTDEEWKVIGPKLQKLMIARQALDTSGNSSGMFGMGPGRGRGGPGGNDAFNGPADNAGGNFGPGGGGGGRGGRGRGGPGGPGGGFGGPGGFGGGPADNSNVAAQPQSTPTTMPGVVAADQAVATATTPRSITLSQALADLQTASTDKTTTPQQLKDLVEVVRAARAKAKTDVDAAQKDLLLLLTSDQQALLVGLGYLD